MLFNLLQHYQSNWTLLRSVLDWVGAEVEQWSYDTLDRSAEEQPPIERIIKGLPVYFQIDCYDKLPDGDLAISIDAHGGPPTLFEIKPSYRFFKRRDGSVYY
jgi:hypothetical protein